MKVVYTFLAVLCFATSYSQEQQAFELRGSNEVVITSDYPGLKIENGNDQKVDVKLTGASVKATKVTSRTENGILYIDINFEPEDQRPVKVTYEYDDGTVVTESGDQMKHWNYHTSPKATIQLPSTIKLNVRATYGTLDIAERTGSMDIQSTYGGITMKLPEGYKHDLKVESGYSFVDLSVSKSTGYSVDLSSTYGEIMSNLDLEMAKKDGMTALRDTRIQGTVGRGGPLLKVCATYQNIYLRGY